MRRCGKCFLRCSGCSAPLKKIWSHICSIPTAFKAGNPLDVGRALTTVFLFLVVIVALLPMADEDRTTIRIIHLLNEPFNIWGDTLAGIAGVLAFLWIIVTVQMQREELEAQREEMSLQRKEFQETNRNMVTQRFEATFFEMFRTFGEIVNSIDLVNPKTGRETTGRDCFSVFYTRLAKDYRDRQKIGHSEDVCLEIAYQNFWKLHQLELSHYFRFLYNFFRFLDENADAKPFHAKLLRSQLSNQELLIIFYNCASPNGKKLTKYAEKFEIFDNLPTERLIEEEHVNLLPASVFGDNPMRTYRDMRHSIQKPPRSQRNKA